MFNVGLALQSYLRTDSTDQARSIRGVFLIALSPMSRIRRWKRSKALPILLLQKWALQV